MQAKFDANAVTMFVAVVDEGSFVGASRALAIPTSTLSRKLAELEDALGVLLLRRTTRRLVVTQSKPIAAALEEARSSLIAREHEPSGLLRVTCSPLLGDLVLGRMIAAFLSRYPRVEIELFLSERLVNLVEEGFDVALRASELEDSSLVARRLARSTHEICATRDFVEHHGRPEHPRDLARLPCVVHGSGVTSNTWRFEHMDGSRASVTIHGPIRTNDLRIGLQVVRLGRAIGSFPELLVGDALRAGELVRLLPDWAVPERWIHALYPSRRHMSITLRTFLDFIADRVAVEPSLQKREKKRSATRAVIGAKARERVKRRS
jgi:DNA-binding transcriptional LysR family regulator